MPTRHELIAYGRSHDQIAAEIGCDRLIYQDLDDLIDAVSGSGGCFGSMDASVFDGQYVTGSITSGYLAQLELMRSDDSKIARHQS